MPTPPGSETGRARRAQFAARPVSVLWIDKEHETRGAMVEW